MVRPEGAEAVIELAVGAALIGAAAWMGRRRGGFVRQAAIIPKIPLSGLEAYPPFRDVMWNDKFHRASRAFQNDIKHAMDTAYEHAVEFFQWGQVVEEFRKKGLPIPSPPDRFGDTWCKEMHEEYDLVIKGLRKAQKYSRDPKHAKMIRTYGCRKRTSKRSSTGSIRKSSADPDARNFCMRLENSNGRMDRGIGDLFRFREIYDLNVEDGICTKHLPPFQANP